jgi:hypothetical protein
MLTYADAGEQVLYLLSELDLPRKYSLDAQHRELLLKWVARLPGAALGGAAAGEGLVAGRRMGDLMGMSVFNLEGKVGSLCVCVSVSVSVSVSVRVRVRVRVCACVYIYEMYL